MSRAPDKLPPHSVDAEAGVLGCVLLDGKTAMGGCVERFKAGARVFFDVRHIEIYGVMLALYNSEKGIDPLTVSQALRDKNMLEQVGGDVFLAALADSVPSAANLTSYADIVHQKYILRRLVQTMAEVNLRIDEQSGDPAPLLDRIEQTFLDVAADQELTREQCGKEFIQWAVDRIENYHRGSAQMLGISTGYAYLDKMTCGLAPGQLIVFAARPGLGKTSLGMNIVEHACIDKGVPTGVFTLEMSAAELGARLMFQVARADYQRFRTGYFEQADLPKLILATKRISLAPIYVDETAALNVLQLRAKARRMVLQYGVKLFLVDYLQLMVATRFYNNREQEVAEMSSGLKAMAKELQVPVVVLAQFNRDIEKDPNRKPRLSDLRESGRIEADADLVGMLYEPKLMAEQKEALAKAHGDWSKHFRRVNLLVAKQRNGPTGDVELEFWKNCMRFESHNRPKATPQLKTNEPTDSGPQYE